MQSNALSRRGFLNTAFKASAALAGLGLTGGLARAIEPLQRAGQPRFALSCAAYSFREFFKDVNSKGKAKEGQAKSITLHDFIDYCADQGCDGAELTSYYFPKDLTPAVLTEFRRHAFLRGVAVSGTSVANNFAMAKGEKLTQQIAHVKEWIDKAAILGAPHIRVFAGPAEKGLDLEVARRHCIESLEECCDYAGTKGIFLGLENHGGIVAEPDQLLAIVKAVKSPWLGVNLDSGNFKMEGSYDGLAKCAPYAVNVQMKPMIWRNAKDRDPVDVKRFFQILRDANYQGFVALEHEGNVDPWQDVPRLLQSMREAMRA